MYSYVAIDLRLRTGDDSGVMAHASKIEPVRGATEVEAYATPWEAFAAARVNVTGKYPIQIFRLSKPIGLLHTRNLARRVAEAWVVDQPIDLALAFSEIPAVGAQVVNLIEAIPRFASRPYIDGVSRTARDFVAQVSKLSGAEAQHDLLENLVVASTNVVAKSRDWDKDNLNICRANSRAATNAALRLWADRLLARTLEPLPLVPERMSAVSDQVRVRLEFARAQLMSVAAYSCLVSPSQNKLMPQFVELWERGAVLYQEWKVGEERKRGSLSLAHIGKDLTSVNSLIFRPETRAAQGLIQG